MIMWTYMNIRGQGHSFFFLETACPLEAKLYVEPLWDGGTKVWSNGVGPMTKMAAMPIYDKNIKKNIFSGTKRSINLKVGMQHWVLEYSTTKFVKMMTLDDHDLIYGKVKFGHLCFCTGKR